METQTHCVDTLESFNKILFFWIIYKIPVRTSQETYYVSATKPNRLMLFRETVAVYCENHTEHTNTLCGQNADYWEINIHGTYSNDSTVNT
jgi:hypothetical protein